MLFIWPKLLKIWPQLSLGWPQLFSFGARDGDNFFRATAKPEFVNCTSFGFGQVHNFFHLVENLVIKYMHTFFNIAEKKSTVHI